MDLFEAHVRAALAYHGVPLEEADVAVMQVAEAVYGPELRALSEADLAEAWPEADLDPSRAPSQ